MYACSTIDPVCRQTARINGTSLNELSNKAKIEMSVAHAHGPVPWFGVRISSHRRVQLQSWEFQEGEILGKMTRLAAETVHFHILRFNSFKSTLYSICRYSPSQGWSNDSRLDSIMLFEDLLSVLLSLFRNSWVYKIMRVSYIYRHLGWKNILFKVAL